MIYLHLKRGISNTQWYPVNLSKNFGVIQGTNARKVISEVYAFFVLQCTLFVRKSKHKTDVTACHGINFHKNNLWNTLFIGNYYVNFQNYQNKCFYLPLILEEHWCIYSCFRPKRTGFNMYAEYTRQQLNFLALVTFFKHWAPDIQTFRPHAISDLRNCLMYYLRVR